MQQTLNLLAQRFHALDVTQYTQGDEVRHTQDAPERLGMTYLRQGIRHGCEQIGEYGLEMAQANCTLDREVAEHRQTAEALKKSDAKLRQILESAADAIVISNEQGQMLTVNRQAERLFGFDRRELFISPRVRASTLATTEPAFGKCGPPDAVTRTASTLKTFNIWVRASDPLDAISTDRFEIGC
jgi:PAS domain-containing protein